MNPLDGWYPGYGEVQKIRRMSPFVQNFISRAAQENPAFLENYLLPTLDGQDAEGEILKDIHKALCAAECESIGLSGDQFGSSWLENVPKALGLDITIVPKYEQLRKEKKQYVKAAKATGDKALVQQAKHMFAKEKVGKDFRKEFKAEYGHAQEGRHWEFRRDARTGQLVATQAKTMESKNFFDQTGKFMKQYGNVLISVAGAVLIPLTGGLSMVAAGLITAGNTIRQKRIAASKAKREGHHAADKEVAKEQAQAGQQIDQFYGQNQQYFVDNFGLTPDKWARLTFDQKVDILKNATHGTVPGSAPPPTPGDGLPAGGGGYGTPAGGGGGGGESAQPGGAPGSPGIATASMFDGAMLPLLAGGVVLAMVFGKPVKGGKRRTKRNPGRRHWRVA